MLDELLSRMSRYTPRTLETDRSFPEAAVLLPVTRSDKPELILTLRASGLSTHGGEVAFPGGRRDPEDPDLVFTALREAEEEIGLPPGLVEVVEVEGHPWFVGTQYHPEYKSTVLSPSPLFVAFVGAALEYAGKK